MAAGAGGTGGGGEAALDVFPAPREVVSVDRGRRHPGTVRAVEAPDLPPQGYELVVDGTDAVLRHRDAAGRRYGDAVVEQLRSDEGTLPHVQLRDWPDVAVRGYMLDVSRDRVPTRETLARLVELLALARYNHLQLYVEHTFAYAGHEVVWRDASPLTGDDLEWLDARCSAAGIELATNQNCFGHMERWLRHDAYRHRAECPDGWATGSGRRRPPTVLAPTEDNAAFARALVREQARHIRGPTVNIGCDETFELGRGASAADVAARGIGAVYLDQLARLVEPLVAEGRHVQFWGDVARRSPEMLDRLPREVTTAVAWTYESPGAVRAFVASLPEPPPGGSELDGHMGFEANAAPFVVAGYPFWVAPGTSTWNSLVGRLDNAWENLLDAAVTASARGAGGVLVTDWGDNGHLQPPSVSDGPILYGGAVAWCAATNRDLEVGDAVNRLVARDPTGRVGRVLERVGVLWGRTGATAFNSSPLQAALCPHQRHVVLGDADPDAVAVVVDELDGALDDLAAARPGCADADVVVEELSTAVGLARHGARRLLASAGGSAMASVEARADLTGLIDRQRAMWLARSRSGGLADSLAHLERTLATYEASP